MSPALIIPVTFGRENDRPLGNRREALRTSGPQGKRFFEVALRCGLHQGIGALALLFPVQTDSPSEAVNL